jgi:hypothetical protein
MPAPVPTTKGYKAFQGLEPFFEIVMEGLRGLVDGEHYFDTFTDDAIFNPAVTFPAGRWSFEDDPTG